MENILDDISNEILEKETLTTKETAKIWGLKYYTARKILLSDDCPIRCFRFGRKNLWIKEDVLEYKRKCYIGPQSA